MTNSDSSSAPQISDILIPSKQRASRPNQGRVRTNIEEFIRAAYQGGPEAEFEYKKALSGIRKEPQEAVVEVAQALGECEQYDYPRRQALIFAVCELRDRAALPLLFSIIETPLPSEPQPPSHGFSIVGEETILRTTAIEGIGHLAYEGDDVVLDALFRAIRQPSISIRRVAIQALLHTKSGKMLRQRITACLPPEQYFLLDLATPRVTEVSQVSEPEHFLSEEARQSRGVKAPNLPETKSSPQQEYPPRSSGKE